jgi:copper(I)-binding protein
MHGLTGVILLSAEDLKERPVLRFLFHVFVLAGLILIAGAIPATAESPIGVEKAWSRATAPGVEIGVGYLTIKNGGDVADRLVSVTTSVAEKTEMHQTQMKEGKMEMRPVPDGIPVPAKGTVTLEPAGYHLMLMGLKAPLAKGSTFTGTLTFEHAGTIDVTFQIEGMGASAPNQN